MLRHQPSGLFAVAFSQSSEYSVVLDVELAPVARGYPALAPGLDPEVVNRSLHLRKQWVARLACQSGLETKVEAAGLSALSQRHP